MQAIILAAGMGKRLKELTKDNTKCMVRVNGVTLIERLLRQLDARDLSRIVIVVGYEGQKLIDYIATLGIRTPVEYVDNDVYYKTNNIYSLSLAQDHLCREDTLLFESDIIFEDAVLDALLDDERPTLALVDRYESWMDGTCVTLDETDTITSFVPGKAFDFADRDRYYKTVNIYKLSRHFSENQYVPFLKAYQQALGVNEYYEQVLRVITMLDNAEIMAKRLNGQKWYEIDDEADLDIAESIFAEGEEKLDKIMARYGGYWRYPGLLDYCYLVNPYFPPKKLKDELRASMDELLTQYPSGMKVNSLLAAKCFGLKADHVVVGNGAAELIKSLMEKSTGKIGVIRPTFEEYPNRLAEDRVVEFLPAREDFGYTAGELIQYFAPRDIGMLVLITPDQPTGFYMGREQVQELVAWTGEQGIKLVIDESFADFVCEEGASYLEQHFLEESPHVMVVKSISKSYGVPGLRLGILASGDKELIASLKKDFAIRNINSFAEFYLQIYEKYVKAYAAAIEKFKTERLRFETELGTIPSVRCFPSGANFIMAELTGGLTSRELAVRLLTKHDILIKDLTPKFKNSGRQFVRLAVRDTADNDRLLKALSEEMGL